MPRLPWLPSWADIRKITCSCEDEYEKAARAAGSAGVASDFRIDKKTSAVEKKDSGEEGELSAKPQVKASAVPQTSGRKSFGTAQVAVSAKAGEKK